METSTPILTEDGIYEYFKSQLFEEVRRLAYTDGERSLLGLNRKSFLEALQDRMEDFEVHVLCPKIGRAHV